MIILERLDHVLGHCEAIMNKLSNKKFIHNAKPEIVNFNLGRLKAMNEELNYYDTFLFDNKMEIKTLHIVVTGHWFTEIVNGKKEECREFTPHWISRLVSPDCGFYAELMQEYNQAKRVFVSESPETTNTLFGRQFSPKHDFKTVTIQLGYSADAPRAVFEFGGIYFDKPKREWFWENIELKPLFVIKLGKQLQ